MIKCPFCGITNVNNTIFCGECGHYLLQDENRATDPLDIDEAGELVGSPNLVKSDSSSQRGSEPRTIRLRIGERRREVEVPLDRVIHLGRMDPGADVFPEVDLTEHSPAKNISRRHANIQKREGQVVIEDMGSVNGTFLNNKRLNPYLPEILRNGDTLQLGKLRIEVEILTE